MSVDMSIQVKYVRLCCLRSSTLWCYGWDAMIPHYDRKYVRKTPYTKTIVSSTTHYATPTCHILTA